MTRAWVLLLLVLFMPGSALSDSSNLEGGVFIAHHPPGLQYSAMEDYCERYFQDFAIDSCSEQNNRIDLDGNQGQTSVWYVLAAWSEEKEWCGAEFGFAAFDSTIYAFTYWGACFPGTGLEIPTEGWPGPDAGVAVTISETAWSGNFLPVYWFMGYSYYEGEIPLAANPASGFGGTANCETPPQEWAATSFGALGVFEDGVGVCPEGLVGGSGLDGGTQPDGADGAGGQEPDGSDGGDGEDPLSGVIVPEVMNARAEHWSFLVTGVPADQISGVLLTAGAEGIQGVLSEVTAPDASLWEFRYSAPDTSLWAVVSAYRTTDMGPMILAQREVQWGAVAQESERDCDLIPGRVAILVSPGALGYEPGPRFRSVDDIAPPDPELGGKLRAIGAVSVNKAVPAYPDSGRWVTDQEGRREFATGLSFRTYVLSMDTSHNPAAVALIVSQFPGVERAFAMPNAPTAECLREAPLLSCGDPNDSNMYDDQWYLWTDGEECGIGADKAWLYADGDDSNIAIIDHTIGELDKFTYVVDDPAWPNYQTRACNNYRWHGTAVASAAAFKPMPSCPLGVAPCATLIPYTYMNDDIYCAGATAAERAFTFNYVILNGLLTTGDVVVWAGGIGSSEVYREYIEEAVNSANLRGICVVVAEVYDPEDPFVEWWPQAYAGGSIVSVGGVNKNGQWCTGGSPRVVATAEDLCLYYPPGCSCLDRVETSASLPAGLVGGCAALLSQASGHASNVGDVLMRWTKSGVVDVGYAMGAYITPVYCPAVENLVCEGRETGVRLSWDAGAPEETHAFTIYSAPSCWGRYSVRTQVLVVDPEQVEYAVEIPEAWRVEHNYKIVATGEYPAECYEVDGVSGGGAVPTPCPPAPDNAHAYGAGGVITVSWDRWEGEDVEYWVYRRNGAVLDECYAVEAPCERFFRVAIPDEPGTCAGGPSSRACVVDADCFPWCTYVYRVMTVRVDGETGLPICASPMTVPLVVWPWGVAGVDEGEEEVGRRALGEWSVAPVVITGGRTEVRLSGLEAGVGVLEIFAPSGRTIRQSRMQVERGGCVGVPAPWLSGLPSGVYFVRWNPSGVGDRRAGASRMVVVR